MGYATKLKQIMEQHIPVVADRPTLIDFHRLPLSKYYTENWDDVQSFKARPDDILLVSYPKSGKTMEQHIPVVADRPALIDFHGLPLTKYYTENWDDVQSFKARPDDILLVSYPKSGSTWLSYILDLLYFGQTCPERQTSIPIYLRVPFLDMQPPFPSGKEVVDELPTTPRIMKSHRPDQFLPQSFWEQNCKDPVRETNQLCSFLGLCLSAEEKEKVLTDMKFDTMAQNKMVNYSTIPSLNPNVSTFLRKGKVGDWKNHFTVSQNELFDEDYKQKMKNPSLHFRTEI